MKLKDFIKLYDNWNGVIVVNDDNLNCIIKARINALMLRVATGKTDSEKYDIDDLMNKTVVAFGFYDNELCVRIDI